MKLNQARLKLKWRWNDALGKPFVASKRKGEIQVLCFHGVCSDHHEFINGRFLKATQFLNLMEAIREHFHVISLEDYLEENLKEDRLNVLLTFDDGYRNNLTLVLPVLEALQLPATVFVTQQHAHWPDYMDVALTSGLPLDRIANTNQDLKEWFLQSKGLELEAATKRLMERVQPMADQYEEFLGLLTKKERVQLEQHPLISLANHGATHTSYANLSLDQCINDYLSTVDYLDELDAAYPEVFAYPFGHYSRETLEALKKAGAKAQFLTDGNPEYNGEGTDRLVINPFISLKNQLSAIENGGY